MAIGASAGGLQASQELLRHIPANTGLAFVIVQHLDPTHPSALHEILQRSSRIPIQEVNDEPTVKPNNGYVIPPNKEMFFQDGSLHLAPRQPRGLPSMPVDRLLASLASDVKNQAISVILSGMGNDGTDGCKLIKEAGGITFAQAEEPSRYSGMPQGAIDAGCVDFVLSPKKIAEKLIQFARHPYLLENAEARHATAYSEDDLNACFKIVSAKTGVDFSQYKTTTLQRRIHRRMSINKIGTIKEYVEFLRSTPGEAEQLYHDVLITVTNFFREPDAFEVLQKRAFAPLLAQAENSELRFWVPGCATGEEAYSIAIAFSEFMATAPAKYAGVKAQIFASDINESSINKARMGLYSESILKDVSPGRLHQFFVKKDSHYQVQKSIRDMVLFARQNIGKDPPFSNVDVISCRNLLIYFDEPLQKRVIPALHYALRPGGYLLLGGSETLGRFADHFEVIDKKHKLYQKKKDSPRLLTYFANLPATAPHTSTHATREAQSLERQFDMALLETVAAASIVVTENLEIVHLRGKTSDILLPPSGQPSFNLNKMARDGILMDMRTAVKAVKKLGKPVRRENLEIATEHGRLRLDMQVQRFTAAGSREKYFIIYFQESRPLNAKSSSGRSGKREKASARHSDRTMGEELRHAREQYKSLAEDHEATLEEYRSANEEVLSTNEELQSLNEELETAKEELQSSNEELRTVNDELHNRNMELGAVNDDLSNLFSNINMPLLMVNNELIIRRFTLQAQALLNLQDMDIGRRIGDLRVNLRDTDLAVIGRDVIASVVPREIEVQAHDGTWYMLRVRAFRTSHHVIAGAVFTFQDIDVLKRELDESRLFTATLTESAREPIVSLDSSLRVITANNSFYRMFLVTPEETEGQFIYNLGKKQWNIPELRNLLEKILPEHSRIDNYEVRSDFPQIGQRVMSLNARRIESPLGKQTILLAIEDVTQLRNSEAALRELSNRLMNIEDAQRRSIARDVHDVTGQKVAALRLNVGALAKKIPRGEKDGIVSETLELADQVTNEIRSLSYLLHPPMLDELGLGPALREFVERSSERMGLQIDLTIQKDLPTLPDDVEITIFRIIQESLTNVHRHSGSKDAKIQLAQTDGTLEVRISDSGNGKGAVADTRNDGVSDWKSGVGVTGMKERVSHLGGTFQILKGDKGTTVVARIPTGHHGH